MTATLSIDTTLLTGTAFRSRRTFLDLGFEVDVIHYLNEEFLPQRRYDVMVDVMVNLGRLADHLDPSCKKFLHPHGAHWTVNNARTYARHAAMAQRRGVSIFPERAFVPNKSVERADYITCRGGEWGRRTFAFSQTQVWAVPQVTPDAIDDFIERDISRCRGRFVFLGGRGMVHKGLDLLLEAFAEMPECHLTVCADVVREPHFKPRTSASSGPCRTSKRSAIRTLYRRNSGSRARNRSQ